MEDWEKKYYDLVNRLKKARNSDDEDERFGVVLDSIAPELAESESEDERIRKNILALVKKHAVNHERCQMEAYLEKQKEQKSAEWSEEDEENFKWFDKFFRAESIMVGGRDIPQDKYLWFKSLRPQPKQEWSEEEKKKIANIMMVLMVSPIEYAEEIEFLKSLRPQPHWKPSEEQMRAVFDASERNDKLGFVLRNLYNDLKKL